MKGKTSKRRWIGLAAVGALAATATVVTVTATGQHPAAASTPQSTTATVLYTGVWVPGSGSQSWRTGMSARSFSVWKAAYTKNGARVQDLRVSPDGTDYTAVWRPGKGAEVVRTGLTSSQFVAANASYAKQGLRVTSLDTGHRITAVWHPGSQAQTISVGLNTTDFGRKMAAEAKASMRPVLGDYFLVAGRAYWVGVFQPGTGAYEVRTTSSSSVFHTDLVNYGQTGLRLVGLGSRPYTGVWRPGSGQWQVWTTSLSTFQADIVKYYKAGLRLIRVGRWTA